ncbi:hypothetical protein [Paenibacillus pinihumi]|uniref:hypothetical protein n=1 Tax=Paenibacillus pinihumi TaxID=669462 RepID=UPI00041DD960|nr:hypothetical protein [Paenibacillus pinihumi]
MSIDKPKPIPGYYGYYISREGQVYSRRNSKNGEAKPLTTDSNGFVRMLQNGKQRQIKVSELLNTTWGS